MEKGARFCTKRVMFRGKVHRFEYNRPLFREKAPFSVKRPRFGEKGIWGKVSLFSVFGKKAIFFGEKARLSIKKAHLQKILIFHRKPV